MTTTTAATTTTTTARATATAVTAASNAFVAGHLGWRKAAAQRRLPDGLQRCGWERP